MISTNTDLRNIAKGNCFTDESLAGHTTFKVGGMVQTLVEPKDIDDLKNILLEIKERKLSWRVIGKGSNLLIGEDNLPEVVIKLSHFNRLFLEGNSIIADSGVGLSRLINFATINGLTGLEFLTGIPGSVGGAIRQNAGAWDKSICEILSEVSVLDVNGKVYNINKEQLSYEYRKTNISNDLIILKSAFKLKSGNKKKIEETVKQYFLKRKDKFPALPNAGCIFKNPNGKKAGEIIDKLGLKGFTIGKAQISALHGNIIVNLGGAKANDVVKLIRYVQEKVYDSIGIKLELEVDCWGQM